MIDYEAFTPQERDNFVKNILSVKEIEAAMLAASRGGSVYRTAEQYLEFCFGVAVRKMKALQEAIRRKRDEMPDAGS